MERSHPDPRGAAPAGTLLCVPTPMERELFRRADPDLFGTRPGTAVAVVGFGPVAAAARAAELIAGRRPARVILTGIAGTYRGEADVGHAFCFDAVELDGVGAGEGDGFLSPAAMGFPQWADSDGEDGPGPIEAEIALIGPGDGQGLLTVCAASAHATQVARRRATHPNAIAEDMEGFGVALSAHLAGVPLTVVRGISNVAGNRQAASWRIAEAVQAAAKLVRSLLDA